MSKAGKNRYLRADWSFINYSPKQGSVTFRLYFRGIQISCLNLLSVMALSVWNSINTLLTHHFSVISFASSWRSTTLQRIKKHLALLTAFETFPLCFCLGFVCPLTCFGKPDWAIREGRNWSNAINMWDSCPTNHNTALPWWFQHQWQPNCCRDLRFCCSLSVISTSTLPFKVNYK